jgi:hypothetical protein
MSRFAQTDGSCVVPRCTTRLGFACDIRRRNFRSARLRSSSSGILNTWLRESRRIDRAFQRNARKLITRDTLGRGNDQAGAISRTTLHIPFNFILGPGEPRRKYIGARIRGSFINIVAVISLSCLVRLRPPDIQMSAGISGLTRFSASKYYLPPRRRALPSP